MLKITVDSYCESTDSFTCLIEDSMVDSEFKERIPAVLMPYIASDACDESENLPFDLVGKTFTLTAGFDL